MDEKVASAASRLLDPLVDRLGGAVWSGLAVLGAARVLVASGLHFGADDPMTGDPSPCWFHQRLTYVAARKARFSQEAALNLAFHCDYVDSYQYNPLWWARSFPDDGLHRVKIAVATGPQLARLHFDDLQGPERLAIALRRYLGGTIVGLWWAHRHPDPWQRRALGQNVIGTSLHALQDFYAHSNWIDDPDRRDTTIFEAEISREWRGWELWTGTYELPDQAGRQRHGKLLPLCRVLELPGVEQVLDVVCHAASPASDSWLCEHRRRCQDGTVEGVREIGGVPLPANVVAYEAGIALDSLWQSEIAVGRRGIDGSLSGQEALDIALHLAEETSYQWLRTLRTWMETHCDPAFVDAVTTEGAPFRTDVEPFERFDQMPYTFLTAGAYPPDPDEKPGWHTRLMIQTGDEEWAGTDSDIVLSLDGLEFPPLDYSPRAFFLWGWSDFEAGDRAAYVVGPTSSAPARLTIRNDAPGFGDVLTALVQGLVESIATFIEDVADVVTGWMPDEIDDGHTNLDGTLLDSLAVGEEVAWLVDLNGRSGGHYQVVGRVATTGARGHDSRGIPWREYLVTTDTLNCVREGEWDRGSSSDEPFLVGVIIPQGGEEEQVVWQAGPYVDVNSGAIRSIDEAVRVRVPPRFGFVTIAMKVLESDDERAGTRARIAREFALSLQGEIDRERKGFFITAGEWFASGWLLDRIDLVGFARHDERVDIQPYAPIEHDDWILGGEEVTFDLRPDDPITFAVGPVATERGPQGPLNSWVRLGITKTFNWSDRLVEELKRHAPDLPHDCSDVT